MTLDMNRMLSATLSSLVDILIILFVFLISLIKRLVFDPIQRLLSLISDSYIHESNLNTYYNGKVVLVTGSSSGIGEAIVTALAEACDCSSIIISGRSIDKINEVIDKLKKIKSNIEYIPWEIDLSAYDQVETSYRAMTSQLRCGPIDILINNAGISSRGGALDTTLESMHRVISTNFYGTVALTRLIITDLIKAGKGGNIAVISSVQGKIGLPNRTSYSASKHALQAYFDGLRGEISPYGISVTIVSPGYVRTQLSMNAVNSDGTTYGKMDDNTAKGMDPVYVAKEILCAVANKKIDIIIADAKSKAGVFAKNIEPEILSIMTKNRK